MKNTPITITTATGIETDDFRAQAQDLISELNNTTRRVQYLTQQLIGMMPDLVAIAAEDTE